MDTLARIRLLTGDDPFWNTQNPLLLKGEVGFRNVEGDDPLMRVGDGLRRWVDLPDMNKVGTTGPVGPAGPQGVQGEQGIQGAQGPPGDAQAPWRVPFWVSDALDFAVLRIGFVGDPTPPYEIHPVLNNDGHIGPYAWWFSPSEQWGLPAGEQVLEMHHWWPRAMGTQSPWAYTYWSVDGPSGPMIEILPTGAGRIGAHGPNSSTLYWYSDDSVLGQSGFEIISAQGKWGLPGGGTLNVWGLVSCHARMTVPSGYPFYISNDAGNTAPGQNAINGLRIGAGYDRSDKTLRVVDGTSPGNTLLEIRGDGAIFISPTRATSWPFNVGYMVDGQLVVQSSSRRYKTNIRSATRARAREIVSKLRVVSFNSLLPDEDPDHVNFGLIAEEVAAAEPTLASFDKEGKAESVRYQEIALLLLPLVQELLGMTEPTGELYG